MRESWGEQRIRRELDAFLPGHDEWPNYPQFRAAGRCELWKAITRHGGPAAWAEEYGLAYAYKRHAWTDAQIRDRLRAALRGSDVPAWPSARWLAARGGQRLVTAMQRSGGAARWARELGLPLRGQPWTPERIDAALGTLLQGRATWPSRREFEQAGLGGLYHAIRYGEGHPTLAARHRLPLQRPRRHRTPARGRACTATRPPVGDRQNTARP